MDHRIQIDVKNINHSTGMVTCGMYTGGTWVKIFMFKVDYDRLVYEGFFIRDGKEKDSAGVLNTTKTFYPEK